MAKKKTDGPLHIVKIRLENVLGLKAFELDDAGQIVALTGPNGSGKSTVLKAVCLALSGQQKTPGLVHDGAEEGSVFLRLSDGTEILRRITREGAREATVRDATYRQPVKQPEGYLRTLVEALSLDPSAFLAAKPKEQAKMLLEAFPVVASLEEVEEAARGLLGRSALESYGLADLAALEERLRVERHAANGLRTQTAKTVEGLQGKLDQEVPPEAPGATPAELAGLLSDSQADLAKEVQAIQAKADAEMAKLLKDERAYMENHAKLVAALKSAQNASREFYEKEKAAAAEKAEPIIVGLRAKIASAAEREKLLASQEATRRMVLEFKGQLEQQEATWSNLEAAVRGVESLRQTMAGRLPVDGVLVDQDGVSVKDSHDRYVRLETLNTAEQVAFAVRLAAAKSGKLRTVIADGLERLDPTRREAFLEEARRSGCQYLMAWAEDGEDLAVESEGEAP